MNFGMECRLREFSSPVLVYSGSQARILVSSPRLQWFSGENSRLQSSFTVVLRREFSSPVLVYSGSQARILVSGPRLQWFSGENSRLRSLRRYVEIFKHIVTKTGGVSKATF